MYLFLPVLSALLLFTSFVPETGYPLAHVALVPYLWALITYKRIYSAWAFGVAFGGAYFFWLQVFHPVTPALLALVTGCWFTLAVLPAFKFGKDCPARFLTIYAVSWAVIEYLQSLGPYGYELGNLGYSQYGWLGLCQLSKMIGVTGLSLIVFATNALIVYTIKIVNRKTIALLIVYVLAVVGISFQLDPGDVYIEHKRVEPPMKFLMVQTDINPYLNSEDRMAELNQQMREMARKVNILDPNRVATVIFPETLFTSKFYEEFQTVHGDTEKYIRPVYRDLLRPFLPVLNSSRKLIIGAIDKKYNAAILVSSSPEIKAEGTYYKQHMVPFGEEIPVFDRFSWVRKLGEALGTNDLYPGPAGTNRPLVLPRMNLGILICWEGAFSGLTSQAAKESSILVNISNDAWSRSNFGHDVHFRFLRFRAIETNRHIIRVGNSGPSALIMPWGEVSAYIPFGTIGVLSVDL